MVEYLLKIVAFLSAAAAFTTAVCPAKCTCDMVQKIVDCSNAGLTEIPWNLPDPLGIKQLILSGNHIKGVVAQVVSYRNLETLDLSNNDMSHIDDNTLNALPALKYLHLQNNRLSSIKTGTLAGLPSLVGLDLSNNMIEVLENGIFGDLASLEDLNLGENSISNIYANAFVGLTSLKSLDLSSNELTSLPSRSLEHATSLQRLNIDGNKIESLPSRAFKAVNRLRELSIESNGLSVISEYTFHDMDTSDLPFLRKLSLRNNKLSIIPVAAVSQLKSVEELDLSQNLIEVVESHSFKNMKKLRVLLLNGMSSLKVVRNYALSEMSDLREVQMHSNPQLKTIEPFAFVSSTHLVKVDLHGNALVSLDSSLLNWNNLAYINLQKNNWKCDCNAKWMQQVLSSLKEKASAPMAAEVKCAGPGALATRSVIDLVPSDFVCSSSSAMSTDSNGEKAKTPEFEARIMIGLISGICGICMTVCVFLMCKYKYQACGIKAEDVRYYRAPICRRLPDLENGLLRNGHIGGMCDGVNPHRHHNNHHHHPQNGAVNGVLAHAVLANGAIHNGVVQNGQCQDGAHASNESIDKDLAQPDSLNNKRRKPRVNFNLNITEHCYREELSPLKNGEGEVAA